jgi:hypothetical protein
MIGAAIGQVLGSAVGVAISPLPIVAVILMLFSPAPARNSLAFLAGWLAALTVVNVLVLAVGFEGDDGDPSLVGAVLILIIGVIFLLLAVKQWRGRPRGDAEPSLPRWMHAIDDFSAAKSFGLATLLGGVNPKNLGLAVAAATSISGSGLGMGEQAVVVAFFVVVASVTIALPIGYYLLAGSRAENTLAAARGWLTANNNTVMTVLFVVLGAKVLGEGLGILFS